MDHEDDIGRPRRPGSSPATRVALVLLGVAGLLVALSLATRFGAWRVEVAWPGTSQVAAWKAIMRLFDVNSEGNVPSWFSSLLLAGGALAAGLVAAMVRRVGGRDAGHWAGLAAVLLLLSLDEVAALHERLRGPAATVLGDAARGPLRVAWVVPGLLLVLVVGIVFVGFVARLPADTGRLVVAAGAMYVGAAVGVEAISGMVLDAQGDRALYLLVTAAEEGLEMSGSVLLLYATMRVLHLRPEPSGGYRLQLATGVPEERTGMGPRTLGREPPAPHGSFWRRSPRPRTPMTRGLQLGHERGAKVLGVLAAAMLVAALVITGRAVSGMARLSSSPVGRVDGAAPYWIGDRVACPPDRPVLATSDGRSYPPGHPRTPPPQVDPVACYQTAGSAAAAGYAPAPAAGRRVGTRRRVPGPHLEPASPPVPAGRRPPRLRGALPHAAAGPLARCGAADPM
jgi:hypothetical protein